MATQPASNRLPAPPGSRPYTRGSFPTATPERTRRRSHSNHPPASRSHRSADIAGRSVALSADIPTIFDRPLAPHHKLIGRWAASRESPGKRYTRVAARRHIERVFNDAVLEILRPIELTDLRVAVLHSEEDGPPAIAIICESMGQLDLGWVETSDAPIPWRAAAYTALEQTLGRALPIFGYQDLFDEIAIYYWDGETDDEAARQSLIDYHGADAEELDATTLPSEMNARRPEWMIASNAAPPSQLPAGLRNKLDRLHAAHKAMGKLPPERDAWHIDFETAQEYLPGIEECSSLPPLTLVPFDQFARELDDVARSGMEMGFMDVAGVCPLTDADRIADWFASLQLGARLLLAAQDLLQTDPANR